MLASKTLKNIALKKRVKKFVSKNKDNFITAFLSTITVLLFFMAFAMVLYALIVVVRFVLG